MILVLLALDDLVAGHLVDVSMVSHDVDLFLYHGIDDHDDGKPFYSHCGCQSPNC